MEDFSNNNLKLKAFVKYKKSKRQSGLDGAFVVSPARNEGLEKTKTFLCLYV